MAFLNTLEQIRRVEWGRGYLWDIQFEGDTNGENGPPSPFSDWFPAASVEEPIYNVESYTVEGFLNTYRIPQSRTVRELSITFYDDANHTLLNWMREWVNTTMFGGGLWVATLEESVRKVTIAKLTSRRELLEITSYWVYPEGALTYQGTSQSEAVQYTVNFVICGEATQGLDVQL